MEDGRLGPHGPDLTQGIAASDLPDGGKLRGHVGEEQVLLRGGERKSSPLALSAPITAVRSRKG